MVIHFFFSNKHLIKAHKMKSLLTCKAMAVDLCHISIIFVYSKNNYCESTIVFVEYQFLWLSWVDQTTKFGSQ